MNNDLMFSSENQKWATRWEFFNKWNERFNFDLDVCASHGDQKCERYYSPEEDGLSKPWDGVFWCNPEYGREQVKWVNCGISQRASGVFLIPARTDTKLFHEILLPEQHKGYLGIEFIKGRITFGSDDYWRWVWDQEYLNGKKNSLYQKYGKMNPAPFPSMIVKCGDCRDL